MKDVKVGFPIIDDVAMKVASLYGMIQPGESQTAAVRAVFFVDPKGVLRAMIYYPLALGRNFDEIRRVLVGLQTIDAFGIALPADWRPGDEVIVPMKGDDQEKVPEGAKCYDWFSAPNRCRKRRSDGNSARRSDAPALHDRRGFPREASSVVYIRISAIRGRSAKAAPLYSRSGIAVRRATRGAVRAPRAVFARYLQFSEGDPSVGARHADKRFFRCSGRAARLAVDRGLERRRENLGARRFAVALAVHLGPCRRIGRQSADEIPISRPGFSQSIRQSSLKIFGAGRSVASSMCCCSTGRISPAAMRSTVSVTSEVPVVIRRS